MCVIASFTSSCEQVEDTDNNKKTGKYNNVRNFCFFLLFGRIQRASKAKKKKANMKTKTFFYPRSRYYEKTLRTRASFFLSQHTYTCAYAGSVTSIRRFFNSSDTATESSTQRRGGFIFTENVYHVERRKTSRGHSRAFDDPRLYVHTIRSEVFPIEVLCTPPYTACTLKIFFFFKSWVYCVQL